MKIVPETDALIMVDVQNDFCPGGALAVTDGEQVVPVLNAVKPLFEHVFATRDWHPANHCSFKGNGGQWPVHCVAGTPGADFHSDLDISGAEVISKGTNADTDAYSGFDGTDLASRLKGAGVNRVVIAGLATDYCVQATALDALDSGFETFVIEDACRGVNLQPGDSAAALGKMKGAGAKLCRSNQLNK